MAFGEIMNILVCIAVAVSAFTYVHTLSKNISLQETSSLRSLKSLMLFWSFVGLYFTLAGINILFSGFAHFNQILVFRLNILIFGMMALPLIYNISYILISNRYAVYTVSTFFVIMNIILVGRILSSEISGPVSDSWGAVFVIEALYPAIVYLAALFIIPVGMILGFLFLMGLGKISADFADKIVFSLVSISFVFDFIFLDVIAFSGELQLASRIFAFLGTVLGYIFYLSSHRREEAMR
jgi:hypothetical protein